MKRVLSIALAVAICLTAMIGCFTVSAAAGTASVTSTTVEEGTATASTTITLASDSNIAATYIDVALPELPLVGIATTTNGLNVMHNSIDADGREDFTVADAANAIRILLDSKEGIVDYASIDVTLTFDTSAAAAADYTVAITDSDAANQAEEDVVIENASGVITVQSKTIEPVLDENLTITLALNVSATINARVTVNKAVASYASYELVVTRQMATYNSSTKGYDLTAPTDYIFETPTTVSSNGTAYYLYNKVGMYELGIDFDMMVKCYDAEGNYVAYSPVVTSNMGQLAYTLYSTTSAEKTKNITIDIAKLGDAAQTYMVNSIDCDLADVASPLSYFPTDATEGAVFNADNYVSKRKDTTNVAGVAFTPNVNLSSNPALSYVIAGLGSYTQDNLSFDIEYINAISGTNQGEVVAGANLTASSNGRYAYLFSNIALYDTNVQVEATIYDGKTALATISYSIEDFVAEKYGTNARRDAVLETVACLGISARAYFNIA